MNPSIEDVIAEEPLPLEAVETAEDTPVEPVVESDDIEVVVEEAPASERAEFNEEQIKAQEAEDEKEPIRNPKIKERIDRLTMHVRERERQVDEERKNNDALLQYGQGARNVIETQAKEIVALRQSLQREALAAREAQIIAAQNDFIAARESADTVKEVAAAQRMSEITQQRAQIAGYQIAAPFQPPPPPQRQAAADAISDPVTANWIQKNRWFAEDSQMRNYAANFSVSLAQQGVAPETETFYNRIDAEMRKRFPERFETGAMNPPAKPQPSASPTRRTLPVATASRTNGAVNGTRKVVLTREQAATANKLGVPLSEYAKYANMVKE